MDEPDFIWRVPKLLDRVRGRIRLKRYSIRSGQLYVQWIPGFLLPLGKKPAGGGALRFRTSANVGCGVTSPLDRL